VVVVVVRDRDQHALMSISALSEPLPANVGFSEYSFFDVTIPWQKAFEFAFMNVKSGKELT